MKKIKLLFILLTYFLFTTSAQSARPDIRSFITQTYRHGLPYEQAKSYGKEVIPELNQMLQDKSLIDYWNNIVLTLGYIGEPSSSKHLIEFLERQKGEIPVQVFRATLSVFYALGHIAQKDDKVALNYLKRFSSIDGLETKKLNFSYSRYKNEILNEAMARQAIQGLGVSGKPDALVVLQSINNRKDVRADWKDNLTEAIDINKQVQSKGVNKVFRKANN